MLDRCRCWTTEVGVGQQTVNRPQTPFPPPTLSFEYHLHLSQTLSSTRIPRTPAWLHPHCPSTPLRQAQHSCRVPCTPGPRSHVSFLGARNVAKCALCPRQPALRTCHTPTIFSYLSPFTSWSHGHDSRTTHIHDPPPCPPRPRPRLSGPSRETTRGIHPGQRQVSYHQVLLPSNLPPVCVS